ncbi:MAG: hypothetical protein IPH85_09015 [Ignavibacteria bacterium]|nr:hypothetical protein [Ignavibacteria bacterium]
MKKISALITLSVIIVSSVSGQSDEQNWLSGMEKAASLYDARGFMRDQSRTIDGSVSVSALNGNVQYQYPISQMTVGDSPIRFSLIYNQSASFTGFRKYDYDADYWYTFKRNRPIWVLGVNGFAVQAFTHTSRNVLRPGLRGSAIPAGPKYNPMHDEQDMNWLLDGYDHCNRMKRVPDVRPTGPFEDIIRLLREDGSVLELIRRDKFTPIPSNPANYDEYGDQPYVGIYVTTDANSDAYAFVTIDKSLKSKYSIDIIKSLFSDNNAIIPHHLLPRQVEYFPGDGTSLIFNEVVVPYGIEPYKAEYDLMGESDADPATNDVYFSGYRDASPSIFYLTAIRKCGVDIVKFDYDGHNGADKVVLSPNPVRGRAHLSGFDHHKIGYGPRGATITALGKNYEIQFDDASISGVSSSNIFENDDPNDGGSVYHYDHGSEKWNDPASYYTWTGLVTGIIDPELRKTEFSYNFNDIAIYNSSFPRPLSVDDVEERYMGNPDVSKTVLTLRYKQMTSVSNQVARYEIHYPVFSLLPPPQIHPQLVSELPPYVDLTYRYEPLDFPRVYDYRTTAVAQKLVKYDRQGTNSILGNGSTGGLLWEEAYTRPPFYSAFSEGIAIVAAVRTTYGSGGETNRQATTTTYRRYESVPSYFNLLTNTFPERKLTYTAAVLQEVETELPETNGTTQTVTEITETLYPFADGHSTWHYNKLLPNTVQSKTNVVTLGQGGPSNQDYLRTRVDYAYEYDDAFKMNYSSVDINRENLAELQFCNPLMIETRSEYKYVDNELLTPTQPYQWMVDLVYESRFKSLGGRLVNVYSFPNITKNELRERWKRYWEQVMPNWTKEQAEWQFNNAGSNPPWNLFKGDPEAPDHGVDEDDDDAAIEQTAVSPFIGLPLESKVVHSTQPSGVETWTVNTYNEVDLLSEPNSPYDPIDMNPTFGRLATTRTYGRSQERSTMQTFTYEPISWRYGAIARMSKVTSDIGIESQQYYQGLSATDDPTWVAGGAVTAIRVSNAEKVNGAVSPSKVDNQFLVNLRTLGSSMLGLPTHSKTKVRKTNVIGQVLPKYLTRAQAYDVLGGVSTSVDANGYVSEFAYDDLGRLKTAWLPHDLPDLSATERVFPNYDDHTQHRLYDGVGWVGVERAFTHISCCSYDHTTPDSRPATSEEASSSGVVRYDPLGTGFDAWFIIGTKRHLPPICNNLYGQCSILHQTSASVPPGGGCPPYVACAVYETSTTYPTWKGTFKMLRSEHQSVASANLKFSLRKIADMGPCFPLTFILRAQDGSILRKWDKVINCGTKIDGPKQGDQVSSIIANGGSSTTSDYVVDFVFAVPELEDVLLSSGSTTNSDPIEVSVEVQTDPSASGFAIFSSVKLELTGTFLDWKRTDLTDFTLAYRYHDNEQRVVGLYSKIDDRSQTVDESSYPSQPANIYSRHARRRVTFITDDLPQKDESNFSADYGALLGSSLQNPAPSVLKTKFDGAGRVIRSDNENAYGAITSYDNMGNPKSVQLDDVEYTWTGINTETPNIVTAYGARTSITSIVKTPNEFGIPTILALKIGPYCRRELIETQPQNPTQSNSKRRSQAAFFDYRGRKVFSVDGYVESTFSANFQDPRTVAVDENLVTRFEYDHLDRIQKVVNPANQVINYTYDDYGNISSTEQADLGRVDYKYSKNGQLRFSQSLTQRAESKVNFRQYDDLGRPLIIGEATIEPPQGDPQLTMFALLQPDNLQATDENLPTVNTTLFRLPVRPVPRIYTPSMGEFNAAFAITENMNLIDNVVPCGDLLALTQSDRFKPVHPIGLDLLMHIATDYVRPNVIAPMQEFENISQYPEFVLQAIWYDELPTKAGAVWGGMPSQAAWNRLAPTGTVRNLKERASIVAYRTHGGQPFHYIVRSYDERGRVEAILRLTENLGFDAVYYSYNSMNSVVSIHTLDPFNQHATFYGYDASGRVSGVWTAQSQNGLGLSTMPYKPQLIERPTGSADVVYSYDIMNNVTLVSYPTLGVVSSTTFNDAGMKMRSLTQKSGTKLFDQRLNYDLLSQIDQQYVLASGAIARYDKFAYDYVGRLTLWGRQSGDVPGQQIETYSYDCVGNRLERLEFDGGIVVDGRTYSHGDLQGGLQPNTLTSVAGLNNQPLDALTYNPNGALSTRQRNKIADLYRTQRLETYEYDAFNLIERYTLRKDAVPDQPGSTCLADAALSSMDDWRYRFGPLQEREQKRQYATSGDIAREGLAWTYTLLGADAKQLATYNGVQGTFCGQFANSVWMWPAEYNTYGPAQTRIITRPQGAKEYPIADHLGSTRLTLSQTGAVLQRLDYEPFGAELNEAGDGARTSYIGREKDNESDLGFYGVRMYEPEYGRFMSVDPLWGIYRSLHPYQYSMNSPISFFDYGGLLVQAMDDKAEAAIRTSVPNAIGVQLKFKDGVLDVESTKRLAKGSDPNDNIAILSRLAENSTTIRVYVADGYDCILGGVKTHKDFYQFAPTYDPETTEFHPGMTLLPKREQEAERQAKSNLPVSTRGVIEVYIPLNSRHLTPDTKGMIAAHELYGHVRRYFQWKLQKAPDFWHVAKGTEDAIEKAKGQAPAEGKK